MRGLVCVRCGARGARRGPVEVCAQRCICMCGRADWREVGEERGRVVAHATMAKNGEVGLLLPDVFELTAEFGEVGLLLLSCVFVLSACEDLLLSCVFVLSACVL